MSANVTICLEMTSNFYVKFRISPPKNVCT